MRNNKQDMGVPYVKGMRVDFRDGQLRVLVDYHIEGFAPNTHEYKRVGEKIAVRFIDPKTKEILSEKKNVYDVPAILEFDEPPSELEIEVTHGNQKIFAEYISLDPFLKQ